MSKFEMITSRLIVHRDGLRFETAPLSHGGETSVSGRLIQNLGECFLIRSIGVVLFADADHLLPLGHPLWINSLFSFEVANRVIYDGPTHKFADPITHLALSPAEFEQLSPELRFQFVGRLNFTLDMPYLLEAQTFVRAVLQPRCGLESMPKDGSVLVVLDGHQQRVMLA
jgi:hypothetical protein